MTLGKKLSGLFFWLAISCRRTDSSESPSSALILLVGCDLTLQVVDHPIRVGPVGDVLTQCCDVAFSIEESIAIDPVPYGFL